MNVVGIILLELYIFTTNVTLFVHFEYVVTRYVSFLTSQRICQLCSLCDSLVTHGRTRPLLEGLPHERRQ